MSELSKKAKVWNEDFKVRAYEVHNDGYANMATICNYLQEAAGNHASKLGLAIDHMEEHNWTWVLSRLKVKMVRHPRWREIITVKTWPSLFDRAYTFRDFEIYDSNNEMIGSASSMWVVISLENRRPVRIPELIAGISLPDRKRALEINVRDRIPNLQNVDFERPFSVRYGDLDMNQHVNNVIYIEWGIEAAPEEWLNHHFIREIDITFRAECLNGETVLSQAQKTDENSQSMMHRLIRKSDNKILALMKSSWE